MNQISKWIKKYAEKNKIANLIVGISGGVDSGLVSTLCAETKLNTYVVSMPIHQRSDQLIRARNHAKWLQSKYNNVTFIEKDLTEIFDNFSAMFENKYKNNLSLANSRSRFRMVTLYQIAGALGGLVVGTGNKVEDFGVGFYTKYGDGGVDISPIADLTKSEVRQMSQKLGVSEEIVKAKPTDGLWEDDRSDEDQIGASYEELEWAMAYKGSTSKLTKRQKEVVKIYNNFNQKNKHKMLPIPVFKK
jgi:NAD+ synthase